MNGIDENSRKVSDIIGMVDSMAFQTNILALNAAVEATARAGEQGRGFAMTVSEVRGLAPGVRALEMRQAVSPAPAPLSAGAAAAVRKPSAPAAPVAVRVPVAKVPPEGRRRRSGQRRGLGLFLNRR